MDSFLTATGKILKDFQKHKAPIVLALTLLVGILFLYPFVNYQPFLSQGDHGRDLYAFEKTLDGASAYRDYWWVYGPFMPFYYAGFDLWLGKNIQSILVGERLLQLASGVLVYLIVSNFFPLALAFLAAAWFWVTTSDIFTAFNHSQSPVLTHFFFTYNHTGGVTALLCAFYSLSLYLKDPRRTYMDWGLFSVFILCLIKLNFGLTAWAAFVFFVFLSDVLFKNLSPNRKHFYIGACLLPVLTALIYLWCLRGLTTNEIRQCLPYLKGDQPYETSLGNSLSLFKSFIIGNIRAAWPNLVMSVLLVGAVLVSAYRLIRKGNFRDNKQVILLAAVVVFLVVNLHEFLLSGVQYRAFWAKPFQVLAIFAFLGVALERFPKIVKGGIYALLVFLLVWEADFQFKLLKQIKSPDHYLALPKAKIFVGNEPRWIDTASRTTEYLQANLTANEKFFALPYDCLYYYLTGRTSPTRQLIFFDHIKIPAEQEQRIIQQLEDQQIRWVLLSSRYISEEQGLGRLGVTYCPLIGKYLESHFQIVEKFGDWQNHPGWAWNHGTMILKRTEIKP